MRDYKKEPLKRYGVKGMESPTKEDFVEIFCTQNLSVKETAAFFGTTPVMVRRWAKKFGVEKTREQKIAVWTNGASKRDTASALAKRINTVRKKYGVDNVSKLDAVKEKKENTCLQKYGVSASVQLPNAIAKAKESSLKKYGTDSPLKRRDLLKKIFQDKYGVDNPGQMKGHIGKVRKTCLKKYGVPFSSQADEVKNHQKETFLKNWGVENPLQLPEVQQKMANARYHSGMGRSNFEKEVEAFIKTFSIPYVVNEFKATINELDIYIPSLKIAIECNGDYWHSTHNKSADYHYNKTEFCKQHGIDLLHIFECEWKNKKDIVKSVISARLGKYSVKYRADKANLVVEPYTAEVRNFFNNNHIQGAYAHAAYCYSLRDRKSNELISCMLFSKDTRNNKYQIILSRFCSKVGYTVPFAATRLFTHFIQDHPEITEVCSYADRRLFTGTLYKKLGFKLSNSTKYDYFYIVDGRIYNKTHGMKSNLRKMYPELNTGAYTEADITNKLGWLKVYDCGKDVWVWTAQGDNMLQKKGEVTRIDVIRKEDVKPEEDEKKDESK